MPGSARCWADKAFERSTEKGRFEKDRERRIEQLEAKLANKNEVIAELLEENVKAKKGAWAAAGGLKAAAPPLNGCRVPHDVRDQLVDYVPHWTGRAETPAKRILGWLELGTSKFHAWKDRYGKAKPTSTTARFLATSGWKTGRRPPSSTSTTGIPWKATAGSPS